MIERTVIPKDCFLCDLCNKALSDGNFIATEESWWYEGWLYCLECKERHKPKHKLIQVLRKGEDYSKSELALPIVMEFGDEALDNFFGKKNT